ncbi:hypothetical protein, partial [Cellulomonas iranensis]|uniref:hypothetical protein n=1 Tax=Cellulomonas iranensis TaxID=76862 RepID=UPI001C4FBC51
ASSKISGVVARLDGDAFAALVLLPAVHEDRALEVVASLRERLHGACAGLGVDVRVAVAASVAGWADAGLLLLEVERELRSSRARGTPTSTPSDATRATLPTRH